MTPELIIGAVIAAVGYALMVMHWRSEAKTARQAAPEELSQSRAEAERYRAALVYIRSKYYCARGCSDIVRAIDKALEGEESKRCE